jgi:hypothetical protein
MINDKTNRILFVVCAHVINPKCCKILTCKEHSILNASFPFVVIEKICKLLIIKRKIALVINVINAKIKKNRKRLIGERINAHGIIKKSKA